jgi:hypothetical protein
MNESLAMVVADGGIYIGGGVLAIILVVLVLLLLFRRA